jgi:hypothetical protein
LLRAHVVVLIRVVYDAKFMAKIHAIVSRFQAGYETTWKACRLGWSYANFFYSIGAHVHATRRNVDQYLKMLVGQQRSDLTY